jgi:hypothetical protein
MYEQMMSEKQPFLTFGEPNHGDALAQEESGTVIHLSNVLLIGVE